MHLIMHKLSKLNIKRTFRRLKEMLSGKGQPLMCGISDGPPGSRLQTLFPCIKPIFPLSWLATLYPRIFVFPLPKWKSVQSMCVVLSSSSTAVFFLSPCYYSLSLTTGSAEPFSLPALRNHALSQFSVVRHPPWQQMCAQLWRLPWQSLFV